VSDLSFGLVFPFRGEEIEKSEYDMFFNLLFQLTRNSKLQLLLLAVLKLNLLWLTLNSFLSS